MIGKLRVAAYQALGLLPEGSGYAGTLRGLGFGGGCAVLVAADEAVNGILGTIMLEPFDTASELARDETEADVRAFAVDPRTQGLGVGRKLLLALIERSASGESSYTLRRSESEDSARPRPRNVTKAFDWAPSSP